MFRSLFVICLLLVQQSHPFVLTRSSIRPHPSHLNDKAPLSDSPNQVEQTAAEATSIVTSDSTDENSVFKLPNLDVNKVLTFLAGSLFGTVAVLGLLFVPYLVAFGGNGGNGTFEEISIGSSSSSSSPKKIELKGKTQEEKSREAVSLFENILTDLRLGYVDEVDPKQLFETGVGAMLRSLDPYTEFENVKATRDIQESVSGKYGGVGLVIANEPPSALLPSSIAPSKLSPIITDSTSEGKSSLQAPSTKKGNGVVVVDTFESYSYKEGLRIGDHIVSVDGIDTTGLSVEGVRDLLRGDPETTVSVTFKRGEFGGEKMHQVTLKRAAIKLSDIKLACFLGPPKDGIGYISLSGFNGGSARDFRTAFLYLKYLAQDESPLGLRGIVLDLRSNPGGLLDAAVEVASYLVPGRSDIVSARSREGPEIVYKSISDPLRDPETKLVILVNGGSASASEIVAGAVQDLDAGIVMGQSKTYGKGLVQKILPLPYDSALKYTIAKYYTPSGRCIQAITYSGGRDGGLLSEAEVRRGTAPEEDFTLGDGAKAIEDKDRKAFFTSSGRKVLDGGGISPDVTVPPNQLSPSESLFVREGLYSQFIDEYIKTHDILPSLHEAATKESSQRYEDPRYQGGNFGVAVEQFLVLGEGAHDLLDGKSIRDPKPALYREFKKFVQDKVATKSISLKLAAVPKLEEIQKLLLEQGFPKASNEVKKVIPRITENLVANMEQNNEQIKNSLELTLFSREFPDRLLLSQAIKGDPQISAARDLISGSDGSYAKILSGENDEVTKKVR